MNCVRLCVHVCVCAPQEPCTDCTQGLSGVPGVGGTKGEKGDQGKPAVIPLDGCERVRDGTGKVSVSVCVYTGGDSSAHCASTDTTCGNEMLYPGDRT